MAGETGTKGLTHGVIDLISHVASQKENPGADCSSSLGHALLRKVFRWQIRSATWLVVVTNYALKRAKICGESPCFISIRQAFMYFRCFPLWVNGFVRSPCGANTMSIRVTSSAM